MLTEVTNARANATRVQLNAGDLDDPAKVQAVQRGPGAAWRILGRLLATSEAYPDLKSNANFLALQDQLEGTENRITRRAATITRRCRPITRASGPSRTRSAPRSSTAPSRRCRSRPRRGAKRRQRSTSTRAEVTRSFVVLLLALFALAAPASAQTFRRTVAGGRPGGHAAAGAGVRPQVEVGGALRADRAAFVVATVNSLEGRTIERLRLPARPALEARQRRRTTTASSCWSRRTSARCRIETGYGAGEYLTDAVSGVIIREAILPQFKKNPPTMARRITAGADAIIKQMSCRRPGAGATSPRPPSGSDPRRGRRRSASSRSSSS